eukprot:SAG31_NODE_643_length_13291_cov_6.294042_7_plen_252_part_00
MTTEAAASILSALQSAATDFTGFDEQQACAVVFKVPGLPNHVLQVRSGRAVLGSEDSAAFAERQAAGIPACELDFESASIFVDSLSHPRSRAKFTMHLTTGAIKLHGSPAALIPLRQLFAALRAAQPEHAVARMPTGELSVNITGVEQDAGVTLYVVEIFNLGTEQKLTIRRRYSDFAELRDMLTAALGREIQFGTDLPPKRLFNNDEVVRERRLMLGQFLAAVLSQPRAGNRYGHFHTQILRHEATPILL